MLTLVVRVAVGRTAGRILAADAIEKRVKLVSPLVKHARRYMGAHGGTRSPVQLVSSVAESMLSRLSSES